MVQNREQYLDKMEADLADGREFLTGDSYTLADIVGTVVYARVQFIKKSTVLFGPRTQAWWQERIKQRPSFKAAYVVSEWKDALMSRQCEVFSAGGDPGSVKWTRPHGYRNPQI